MFGDLGSRRGIPGIPGRELHRHRNPPSSQLTATLSGGHTLTEEAVCRACERIRQQNIERDKRRYDRPVNRRAGGGS
jgi:hypothetical protein